MNQQEFYELVKQAIDKLEVQGVPAKEDDSPRCWYHMIKNGVELRCIVGHMMPLEVAKVADGGLVKLRSVWTPPGTASAPVYNWVAQFTPEQVGLLCTMQEFHDDIAPKDFTLAIREMREANEQSIN